VIKRIFKEGIMQSSDFVVDEFNQTLLKNVFPKGWKNPTPAKLYDLVVVGAGPGGMTAAMVALEHGARVAIVEKEHFGGECLNVGCIPSKALLRSSRLTAEIHDAFSYGIEIPKGWTVNFPSVMERVRRLRSAISLHDAALSFKKKGIDVFLGKGHFTSSEQVDVAGQILHFKKAIIATGTQPMQLSIPGLEEASYLTNQTIFNLTALPRRLAVLGSGPIGCELSQAFLRFGSQVTLITRGTSLMPRDDALATQRLQKVMEEEGMEMLFRTQLKRVEKKGKAKVLHLDSSTKPLLVDEILVATGRSPMVEGMGLEKANVTYDLKDGIAADDFLQTTNPHIYAVGDVSWRHKFTHVSMELGKLAAKNALGGARLKRSSLVIPWCTYTDPEIAHIGMQESKIQEKQITVQTVLVEMADIERANLDGETTGFVKIHVQEGTDQIVGATIMAKHAGDLISEIAVAMASQKGMTALAGAIHPFPTQAAAIRNAAESYLQTLLEKRPMRRSA
jgi:pyruvate/2-oxoglutarate dehydrogenase complex dihydrolipoamide dehydrogenase (E3) component